MKDIVLIQGPSVEPITLADAKLQLGFGPMEDSDRAASSILSDKLRAFIAAGRMACEDYTRRAFITQRRLLKLDGFPGSNWTYEWDGYPEIPLPFPPTQSIDFLKYVDTAGAVQTLTVDTTYGNSSLQYCYQFARGSETQAARLLSGWARPWPPTRMVPANVLVQFRCGYGGPLVCSTTANSNQLQAPSFKFNPDDAPLMSGDTGLAISIPGAGANGSTLSTFVASVDGSGNATLADAAAAAVANVTGWQGQKVPEVIRTAIKMLVQFYYEHGGCDDVPMPRVIQALLDPYRNLVA